jgi:drug/metabolite transporter (DMT)-like permease
MGIAIGAVSSLVAALFSVLNKKYTVDIKSRTAIFYEMSGGIVVLTMIIPIYMALLHVPFSSVLVVPSGMNLWWMLCHALFCTVGLYMLQIQALRVLNAFTVNLTYNLEPCYTILMAFIFFGEGRDFNFSFYVGIALVILSVSLQTVRALRGKKG